LPETLAVNWKELEERTLAVAGETDTEVEAGVDGELELELPPAGLLAAPPPQPKTKRPIRGSAARMGRALAETRIDSEDTPRTKRWD
jgi:hypothetical protein